MAAHIGGNKQLILRLSEPQTKLRFPLLILFKCSLHYSPRLHILLLCFYSESSKEVYQNMFAVYCSIGKQLREPRIKNFIARISECITTSTIQKKWLIGSKTSSLLTVETVLVPWFLAIHRTKLKLTGWVLWNIDYNKT